MRCSYRFTTLIAATLTAVPLLGQSTRADQRAAAAANSATQMPVVIPAGTPLTVAIDEDLSSASVNQGQEVSFHLTADYSEFGHVLIAQGTPVRGTVAHVARRSAGGNPGTQKGLSAVIAKGTEFTVFTDAKRTVVVPR